MLKFEPQYWSRGHDLNNSESILFEDVCIAILQIGAI